MRSQRFLAAAVSLLLAAGQTSVTAFAESTDSVNEQASQAVADTDDTALGDENTTDDETTSANDIGDVNGDNSINVADIVKAAAYVKGIRGLDKKEQAAADINFDGKVNVTDIVLLAGHVKGITNIKYYIDPPVVKEPRPMQTNVSSVEFNVTKDTGKVSWRSDEDMQNYSVTFKNGDTSKSFTTSGTSADIPYEMFRDGRLTVTVQPMRIVQTEDGTRAKDYGSCISYVMKIKPAALKGSITVQDADGKALVKWESAEFASGYRIYDMNRAEKDGMPHLMADTQKTEFTMDFPTDGKEAVIMVVPFNSNGESTGMTAKVIGTAPTPVDPKPVDPTPVDPKPVDPTPVEPVFDAPGFDVHNYYYSDCNSATIYWYAVNGAEGYQVCTTVNKEIYEYFTTDTRITLPNLKQGVKYDVTVRAYKTVNGSKVYGKSSTLNPITDAEKRAKVNTPIYYSTDLSSSQIYQLSAGNVIIQTDLPENGWTRVFVPNSNGTQRGYIPSDRLADYAFNDITIINQDGWLGGDPAVLGCEETSLASVLKYRYDIDVSKNTLLNYYMPEQAFSNGTINVDPNYCFWGSPYHMEGSVGYGVYAPVVAQSAHQYLKYIGRRDEFTIKLNTDYYTGENVNRLKFDPSKLDLGNTVIGGGLDFNGLKAEIDKGGLPIVWYSEVDTYPVCTQVITAGGLLTNPGTGTYNFTWYGRQHTVVLLGYDDMTRQFIIGNVENFTTGSYFGPKENIGYDFFMSTYNTLGRQSVTIYKH